MSEHPPRKRRLAGRRYFTLGHSTLPIERFIALLRAYGIERLVDIRTVPVRVTTPIQRHHAGHTLRRRASNMLPMQTLGGLRHARKDSTKHGWRNASFRGYADICKRSSFATRWKR